MATDVAAGRKRTSRHALGVWCGLAAGAWLGGAEAPTKLVLTGLSPFAISLTMVAGVFVARWSFPTLLSGTTSMVRDVAARRHLVLWAVMAGALWAVANTLTIFAIRDVGLAVAFPLWNANTLVGLVWGWLLFGELRGATAANRAKVIGGAVAIVAAAILLGFSLLHGAQTAAESGHHMAGLVAAAGASLMWGTMYVPYRKAYLSGMSPLSFVAVFTVGELVTMATLTLTMGGGYAHTVLSLRAASGVLFWLFLGGFCWVIGDLFQQYATKYLGIGRGIPLSNTNQLWGLGWGALVFGELTGVSRGRALMVVGGSLLMIAGAVAIGSAEAGVAELAATEAALRRECAHYGLSLDAAMRAQEDAPDGARAVARHRWWDYLIMAVAVAIFVALARGARVPTLPLSMPWVVALTSAAVVIAVVVGLRLQRETGFR